MQINERVATNHSSHNHNTPQLTKDIQVSQGHRVWEEDRFLAEIGLSIDSMQSLNRAIDAAMAMLENGQLDITSLTPEQEILFFGGSSNV